MYCVTRKVIPWDVQELYLTIIDVGEDLAEYTCANFAMVEAQELKHAVLVNHVDDALRQLCRHAIIAEVERFKLL